MFVMQAIDPKYQGGEVCVVEEEENRGRMMRGTFILLLSVPVVTSLYLLGRVWWVLCRLEREGTILARDDDGEDTEEDSIDDLEEEIKRWVPILYNDNYEVLYQKILLWKCQDLKKSENVKK